MDRIDRHVETDREKATVQASGWKQSTALLLTAAILCQGCALPNARLQYLVGDSQSLSHYEDLATAIEYPIEDDPRQTDPSLFLAPRSINDLNDAKHRPMTLDECVRLAVSQSAILRDDASFGSPANPLMANPGRVSSVYDSAIQDTGFLFGNRGPEAALSDFDALLTNNVQWGRSEDPQNTPFFNLGAGETLTEESAQWSSRIEKPLANSGTFSVQHDWNYSGNNVSQRLFPSAYTGFLQGEYRQPLLQGSGTEFTRIAGPISQNLRGVSGVSQGVLISRINSDISLIDFEQSVSTLVRDVESRYWDLYLAIRLYDSEIETFKELIRFWNTLSDRSDRVEPGSVFEAQSRIFEADARIKGSLADVLDSEARLRRLMGLPLNDGEFITPADHPSDARLTMNWESTLTEALAHRTELRRQKWEIKSLELQLRAAKNLSRPRLDLVSQYRVNGFGDQLMGREDDDGATDAGYNSAYESLTQGNNTTWNLGLSFSMPLGLRLARAQVRNYELRLVKARAVLNDQEREVAYELNTSILNIDRWYSLAESSTKRLSAAIEQITTGEERIDTEGNSDRLPQLLSSILQAKISQREAEQAYLRSIVEYNKAIVDLNFRKGMSLQNQSIYLAEGEWNPGAYEDARKRAEATTAALNNPFLKSEPLEFVGGAAPSAWESLGNPERPHLLDDDAHGTMMNGTMTGESTLMVPMMQVPDVPGQSPARPSLQPEISRPIPPRSADGWRTRPTPNTTPAPAPAPRPVPAPEPVPEINPDSQLEPTPPVIEPQNSQPVPQQDPLPRIQPLPGRAPDRVTRLPDETAARVKQVSRPVRSGTNSRRVTRIGDLIQKNTPQQTPESGTTQPER